MVSSHDAFYDKTIHNMAPRNNFAGLQIIIKADKGDCVNTTILDGIEL